VFFLADGARKMPARSGGAGLRETLRAMHELLRLPAPRPCLAVTPEFLAHRKGTIAIAVRVPVQRHWIAFLYILQ